MLLLGVVFFPELVEGFGEVAPEVDNGLPQGAVEGFAVPADGAVKEGADAGGAVPVDLPVEGEEGGGKQKERDEQEKEKLLFHKIRSFRRLSISSTIGAGGLSGFIPVFPAGRGPENRGRRERAARRAATRGAPGWSARVR